MSNKSNARKNRKKYRTSRQLRSFKLSVMDYPNANGIIYPSLNFGAMKFSKELVQEISHPQATSFSISSRVDEGYSNTWDEGIKHAQEPSEVDFLSPWPNRMNFTGVWSNPVDVSNFQGPSFEEVKIEAMVQKAKHQLRENTLMRVMETAKILGVEIEVDPFLLRDDLKVFKHGKDVFQLNPIEYDSHEWVIVMIAICQHPELINSLKGNGYDFIHIQHSGDEETTIDTYQLIDIANDKDTEAFKPMRFSPSVDFSAVEQTGKDVVEFTARKLRDHIISWDLINDK